MDPISLVVVVLVEGQTVNLVLGGDGFFFYPPWT